MGFLHPSARDENKGDDRFVIAMLLTELSEQFHLFNKCIDTKVNSQPSTQK